MPFLQVMQLASNWGNQSGSRKQLIESSITLFFLLYIFSAEIRASLVPDNVTPEKRHFVDGILSECNTSEEGSNPKFQGNEADSS